MVCSLRFTLTKFQTRAQKNSKVHFIEEIWWPIWERGRSVLYPEDSHIIQESGHIWQWRPLYDCQSPLNCPHGDMAIQKKCLNLLLKLPTLTYNLNWYTPINGHQFKFSNKHPVFKPSYKRNKAEDTVGYQGPCKHNVQNALSRIMPIFHFPSFILFGF